jgi:hypothetical protein
MERRGISREEVDRVVANPGQSIDHGSGRVVFQSRITVEEPVRSYLLRVILDVNRQPPEVVTAYRTSKIGKYWRREQ